MGRAGGALYGILTATFVLFHVAVSQLLMPDGQLSDTIQLALSGPSKPRVGCFIKVAASLGALEWAHYTTWWDDEIWVTELPLYQCLG